MKVNSILKSILLLCFVMTSFALQAKTDDSLHAFAQDVYGYSMETTINHVLDPIKETHVFKRFNDDQKMAYILHLKAHFYHVYEPIIEDALKRNFSISEMENLLKNSYLLEERPYLAKMHAASELINKNIKMKNDEIARMVAFVTAHHLCLEKGKGDCPKTKYSEYPQKSGQKNNKELSHENVRILEDSAIAIHDKVRKSLQKISPESANWHAKCKVRTQLSQNGKVLDVSIVKSTGDKERDKLIVKAVRNASPLPLPSDPILAEQFRDFTLTFK